MNGRDKQPMFLTDFWGRILFYLFSSPACFELTLIPLLLPPGLGFQVLDLYILLCIKKNILDQVTYEMPLAELHKTMLSSSVFWWFQSVAMWAPTSSPGALGCAPSGESERTLTNCRGDHRVRRKLDPFRTRYSLSLMTWCHLRITLTSLKGDVPLPKSHGLPLRPSF